MQSWSSGHSMQLRKAVENKMFPHLLAMFQWVFLVISLAFNLDFSVAVTGAVANGGLKVIMLFHLWILFFPFVLSLLFYRIRKEGIAERCITALSIMNVLFSVVNVFLYFTNDLALLMKATEVIAWSLFNCMFSVSMYKISTVLLLPVLKGYVKIHKETLHSHKRIWA